MKYQVKGVMKKTIKNNIHLTQSRRLLDEIDQVLDGALLDIENDHLQSLKKTEQLQYIESLICSLTEMTKQSGETFLVHLLTMALHETRDRQRALSRTVGR
jgi:vacuolar-type H+-ATPase subunit E/Vma4